MGVPHSAELHLVAAPLQVSIYASAEAEAYHKSPLPRLTHSAGATCSHALHTCSLQGRHAVLNDQPTAAGENDVPTKVPGAQAVKGGIGAAGSMYA